MINHKNINNAETYKNLLDERSLLLERARTIAEKCNALVPIAKLPPEILLRIFIINASSHDNAQNFIEGSRQIDLSRDARRVGQVCRYWRQLALESPTLWNILLNCDSTPPQWAAELVRRSGTLPLKVTVNFYSSRHIRRSAMNFRMALPHFRRLGELEAFCGDVKPMTKVLFKRLRHPMPMLRILELSADYDPEEREDPDDLESDMSDDSEDEAMSLDTDPYLPPFPHEDACHLLRLKTSGYLFRLDSPLYHHLTELAIFDIDGKVPDVAEWCALIQTLGNLTSLTLVDVFPKSYDQDTLPDMNLPHLTSLRLTGRFLPCSQFLVHISAPPLRSFDIHIYRVDFRSSTSDNLLDNILDHLTRQNQIASPPSLRAIINRRSIHITDSGPEANADCLFRIHLEYGPTESKEFGDYLLPSLKSRIGPESSVRIDNSAGQFPPLMVQGLITLMAPYASIQTIKINFELSANFLLPLLSGFGPAGSMRFPLSLRQIQHMTIHDMNWHSGSLDSLSKFVTWRANSGAPLDCLRFKYPDYSSTVSMPDECARLQPFCAKLVWEGGRNQHRNRRRNTSELDTDDSMNEALFGEDGSDF